MVIRDEHGFLRMDVLVDGKPDTRLANLRVGEGLFSKERHQPPSYEPKLNRDERCLFTVGSDVPHIIKIRE